MTETEALTAAIAKALLPLRRASGIASVRQNYKGTGSQSAVRQLWCRLTNGNAVDVWLYATSFKIGGVTILSQAGNVAYADRNAAEIAADIARRVSVFLNEADTFHAVEVLKAAQS